ncbi:MAG TPA: flippase [Capsulimonadaceae bacterium]|nr:flippase [Capsulimonadaceae bacterium]
MISQIISWALTFLVTIYVPRYLGDSGYGLLTLAGTFAAFLGTFVDIGTGTFLAKEIARDKSRVGEFVTSALALRLPLALGAAVIGIAVASLLHYSLVTRELIAIGLGVLVLSQFTTVVGTALYGMERIRAQSVAGVVDKFLVSTIMIALAFRHAPLWQFVGIGMFTTFVSLGLNIYYFRDYLHTLRRPRLATMLYLAKGGLPFITTTLFNSVYIKTDILLLSKMASIAAIGWYGLASKLAGTCMMIPANLCSAMLPTATRIYHEDPIAFGSAVRRTFNLTLIFVVPFSAVLLLAPTEILSLLHYPAGFLNAAPVLRVWGFSLVLYYLSQVASMALTASDRQWTFSRVTGIAAAFSIPLTAVCIYASQRYFANGAVGASISDALAEIYITGAYIRALPAGIFNAGSLSVLGRALIAALPAIAVLHFFVHNRYDLIWLVPTALVYLPLCWAMRCLHPRDIEMIKQMVRRG